MSSTKIRDKLSKSGEGNRTTRSTSVSTPVNLNASNSSNATMVDKIDAILNIQLTLQASITSIQEALNHALSENEFYRDKITNLEKRCESLESKLLPVSSENSNNSSYTAEFMMREIQERNDRAKNIILFNVKENATNSIEDQKACDVQEIQRTIGQICRVPPNSVDDVKEIFKNKFKLGELKSPINIRGDETPSQRDYFRQIQNEFERRKQEGENDLNIKYIKGIPTIMKYPKN